MSYLYDFFSLFYPKTCYACSLNLYKNESVICTSCLFKLPKTNYHLEKDNPVCKIFWGKTLVEHATAYYFFSKTGKVQHLIHHLKYKKAKEVGVFIGEIMGKELLESEFYKTVDVIIPVPLHPKKEKKRGYNQAEIFAIGLSKSMNLPLNKTSLIRTYASESQTKKTRFKRWENVKEIFSVNNTDELKNKHILIVDDVVTTGATLESCINLLLNKIDGIKVSVAAIAVASN